MDRILLAPPGDGISCLSFAPAASAENLLVSSWDSTTRLYDSAQNFPKATYNFRSDGLQFYSRNDLSKLSDDDFNDHLRFLVGLALPVVSTT